MIIAFMGNDASGKSTVAHQTIEQLGRPAKYIPEFSSPLIRLFRAAKRDNSGTESTEAPRYSPLVPYVVWVDSLLQMAILKTFYRGKTVILDRYNYDHSITWQELGLSNKVIEFLYLNLSPHPDLTIWLKVKPEVAVERRISQSDGRKPKELTFYQKKEKLYRSLQDRQNIFQVDNNGKIQVTVSQVLEALSLKSKLEKLNTLAISGLDGAGKSTTTSHLITLFKQLNIKYRVNHFYYNYSILKLLRKIKPDSSSESQKHAKSIQTERASKVKGKSPLWIFFVLGDAYIQYLWMRIIGVGRVIIFDRFFYDYIVSFNFLGIRYSESHLLKIFPVPDRYFLLVADHRTLHDRKPEHTLEFFEYCHHQYEELEQKIKIIEIDTGHQAPEAVLGSLVRAI